MCTLSFVARAQGFLLGMNRDEKLTRVQGLPPQIKLVAGRKVIRPTEPGGGTWIALNDGGVAFGLINWYSVAESVGKHPLSRGMVINSVAMQVQPGLVGEILQNLPISKINPFRLIGVFPTSGQIFEWQWNLKELSTIEHPWKTAVWISSGFEEPHAQVRRGKTFKEAFDRNPQPDSGWLRRLHSSHDPARGPFSICVHRPDAATVSYTEIEVSKGHGKMLYHGDAPCSGISGHAQGFALALD